MEKQITIQDLDSIMNTLSKSSILEILSTENISREEGFIAACILEKRCPTPNLPMRILFRIVGTH